jgi:hypothetical protein
MTVLSQILEHNPQFTADMTRLEVCSYPISALLKAYPI